ncbi:MAG: DUF58 domain-containing protein, partial [Isosphaeraceae bacterium]
PEGSLEWAIRVAASLLDDWIGQGADAGLVVGDRAIAAKGGTVSSRRATILDAIARLDPAGAPPLSEVLCGPVCRRFGRGLRVVVCTDRARVGPPDRAVAWAARFAVLAASAFDEGGTFEAAFNPNWPIRPWIAIDDPRRVPEQVRGRGKEVGVVR